jgi:hypothetical protein
MQSTLCIATRLILTTTYKSTDEKTEGQTVKNKNTQKVKIRIQIQTGLKKGFITEN